MKSMNVIRKSATWFVLLAILTAPSLLRAQGGDHMSKDDVKALISNAKTAGN